MPDANWPFGARGNPQPKVKRPRKTRSDKGTKRAVAYPNTRLETFKLAEGYQLMFRVRTSTSMVEYGTANLYAPRDRHWHALSLHFYEAVRGAPEVAGLYLIRREKHTSDYTMYEYTMAYYCAARKTWFERSTSGQRWFEVSNIRLYRDDYYWAGITPKLAAHLGLDQTP